MEKEIRKSQKSKVVFFIAYLPRQFFNFIFFEILAKFESKDDFTIFILVPVSMVEFILEFLLF